MPGYTAKCSLLTLSPGLCGTEAAGTGSLQLRRQLQPRDNRSSALRVLSSWAARAGFGPPFVMNVAMHTRK